MSEAGVGLAVRGARRAEHDELEGEEKVAGTLVGGGQPALSSTCPGLKGGTKTQEISPPSSTPHLQFPTFCVSAFHQQAYDYKGVKQEGPFTKAGGTHELRVGVPAQGWGWRGLWRPGPPDSGRGRSMAGIRGSAPAPVTSLPLLLFVLARYSEVISDLQKIF